MPARALTKDQAVEVFEGYKYPGTILHDKLTLEPNTDEGRRKALQECIF